MFDDFHPDPYLGRPGGTWALDVPDVVPFLWGNGREIAWARGEALMIVGGDGAGKSALALNLILRLAGLLREPLLGLEVLPRTRVAYLAQDRPRQAQRALRRMLGTVDRDPLDESLMVIDWPLPTLDENPELLAEIAGSNKADVVIVDSLKDVVREPSSEESGAAVKRAYSTAIAEGVDVCLLHHDRKASSDSRRRLLRLSDVYGSRWMVAGCGSVLALNGTSGDPVVELRQLKQVVEEVGPLRMGFDFETGLVHTFDGGDLLGMVNGSKRGLTANDAARLLYETEKPTAAERERARRKLNTLVGRGLVVALDGETATDPKVYCSVVNTLTEPLTQGVFS